MRRPVIAALLALPLALAGCAGEPPAPATPNVVYVTATPPVIAADAPASDSPCTHLLWPLDAGNQWTYRLTTPNASTEQALRAELAPSGAVVLASGLDARPMICGEDALAGLPPLPVGHPALGAGVLGANPSGSLLPAPAVLLPLGQPASWDQQLDAGGTIQLPPNGEAVPIASGTVVMVHDTMPLETVEVPAGSFLALPVEQEVLFDLQVQRSGGVSEAVLISASARLYYAEGVGLVRADYLGGTVSAAEGAWPLPGGTTLALSAVSVPVP